MDMTGYTKLFGSIVASTIWREPHQTRIVWITMLALANKNGIVEASIPGLADLARVTIPECEEALEALQSPDTYSRTKEHDGRRIKLVDGGWAVLNHAKYRAKMGVDERREYLTEKKREERARVKVNTTSTNVNNRRESSTGSTQSEAEAEPKSDAKAPPKEKPAALVMPEVLKGPEFQKAWVEWIQYRRAAKLKPYVAVGAQKLLTELSAMGAARAVAAINHSIAQGWQGIHEPRPQNGHSQTARPLSEKKLDPEGWRDFLKSVGAPYEPHEFATGFLKRDFMAKASK